jgi:ABC-type multidrug transport system fused ATPase/permease subunit
MAALAICLIPFLYLPPYYFIKKMRRIWKIYIKNSEEIFKQLEEYFSHIYLIKAFGKETAERRRYLKKLINNIRTLVKNSRLTIFSSFANRLINRLIIGLIILFGGYQVIKKQMTLGALTAIMIYIRQLMSLQTELADFFECPVLDEYSSEELTRIAAQCYNKTYHIFEDINYMETLDDNGEPTAATGILTGTNLHNLAMPMIRYQQNDLGQIVDENCSCGWKFRKLKKLQGRKNDSFILPSGKILTSGFLLDLTYDFLLEDRTAVLDFCLIQQEKNKIVLEIVKGKGWGNFVAEKIKNKFNDFLEEDVNFCVNVVNECTKTKTGKRNPIINLSNRQK